MSRILTLILLFIVTYGNSQVKLENYSYFNLSNKFNYANSFLLEPIKDSLSLDYFNIDFKSYNNLKIEPKNFLSSPTYSEQFYFNKIEKKILSNQLCPGTSNYNLSSKDFMLKYIVDELTSRILFKIIKNK